MRRALFHIYPTVLCRNGDPVQIWFNLNGIDYVSLYRQNKIYERNTYVVYKTWTKQKSEKVYNWDKFRFGYLLPYVFTSPQLKALRKSKTKGQTGERKEYENKWKYKGKHYSKHITLGKEFLEFLIETIKCLLSTFMWNKCLKGNYVTTPLLETFIGHHDRWFGWCSKFVLMFRFVHFDVSSNDVPTIKYA